MFFMVFENMKSKHSAQTTPLVLGYISLPCLMKKKPSSLKRAGFDAYLVKQTKIAF